MRRRAVRPIEILVIEDAPNDVVAVREALAGAKIVNNLRVVENGEQALDYLNNPSRFVDAALPDLIFLDWCLPGMSAEQFLTSVRSDVRLAEIPIAVLAAPTDPIDPAHVQQLQADWFIVKPIEFETLMDIVRANTEWWLCVVAVPNPVALTTAEEFEHD